MIPEQGSQKRVTLSLESICTIPFQAGASDVKMPQFRQHSSNCRIRYLVNVFGTFRGTWNWPNMNPGELFWCMADISSNITNCEIQRPDMLITRKICQVSLVGCTYDWHNRRSGVQLILCIQPPITCVHLAVDSMTLRVSEAHWYKIEVSLKWEMFQQELDTFENIPVE